MDINEMKLNVKKKYIFGQHQGVDKHLGERFVTKQVLTLLVSSSKTAWETL